MQNLLIASGNPHKVDEIRAVLATLGIGCTGLGDLDQSISEPQEDGATFEENARIKAIAYAKATESPCIADDSGLEIDALDGRPGVYSARYADDGSFSGLGRDERDALNNQRILRELDGCPDEARTARFVCVLCVADPDGTVQHLVRGEFEGRIGTPPRTPSGSNGFGYDPLFLVAPSYQRTSAELEPAEKNRISHRATALRILAEQLRTTAS